jgi:hypothetical protein
MTIRLVVIARSEATKQSRSPTQRVGECVGEANLFLKIDELDKSLKDNPLLEDERTEDSPY